MTATLVRMLLETSLRAGLLAAAVGLILGVGRIRSSAVRHAAWTAVLFAMVLMPVLPSVVPPIPMSVRLPSRAIASMPFMTDAATVSPVDQRHEPAAARLETEEPRTVSTARRTVNGLVWPSTLVILYGGGVVVLLSRLLVGWLAMVRIARTGRRVSVSVEDGTAKAVPSAAVPSAAVPDAVASDAMAPAVLMTYESTRVAAPLIAGVFRPRIILPTTWATWPNETLRAVLAHERAHVRRRDPLIGLFARVNRCAFWFHPLAWWLERTLAATAEHACDDAGVRAIGERRRYAEVLLDMADTVRRSGGRFSWQGVGVDGNGLLDQRIDRILGGDPGGDVSRIRKATVAASCAAAIVLAVACRQTNPPAPLQPDPKTAEQRARSKADQELFNAARAMSPQQVADLDAAWRQNPEDLAALKKLLIFYGHRFSDKKVDGQDAIVAARRPYILWLIAHHPEHELAGALEARIFPTSLDPLPDPAGYARARALWLAKTSSADVSAAVLGNAARFLEGADKPLAETMLVRAQAAAPAPQWSRRLGELYARAIIGSNAFRVVNVRAFSVAEAHSAFAQDARRKLAGANDDVLLAAAGRYLTVNANRARLDFDQNALGRTYLERALELNPTSIEARSLLASLRAGDRNRRLRAAVRTREIELAGGDVARKERAGDPLTREEMKKLAEYEYRAVSSLPEPDRFAFLPELADTNYMSAEALAYTDHDQPRADAAYERSRKYAEEALALAPTFRNDAGYGTAIYRANVALGTHALREGNVKTAVRYMMEAVKAPASEEIAYTGAPLEGRLVTYLLESGERQSVVEFLDRAAQLRARDRERLLEDAAAIREGRMPIAYQHMVSRQ